MNDSLRVPDLYHHLLDHAEEYRAVVCAPYLFWTTFVAAQVAPERTVLVPCLHDEPYARLELFQPMFGGVAGVMFLTEPEAALAADLIHGPPTKVVGAGLDVPEQHDPDGFRPRHGLTRPFVLAGGRREGAKGWDRMMDGYARAVRRGVDIDLVTFGVGEVGAPDDLAHRVIDLGFLAADDLTDAYAAADAYIQPSAMESFSRTIMEAWLAGTPVIANAASDVVAWHCERSGAGLVYEDVYELEQCLRFVAESPDLARRWPQTGAPTSSSTTGGPPRWTAWKPPWRSGRDAGLRRRPSASWWSGPTRPTATASPPTWSNRCATCGGRATTSRSSRRCRPRPTTTSTSTSRSGSWRCAGCRAGSTG